MSEIAANGYYSMSHERRGLFLVFYDTRDRYGEYIEDIRDDINALLTMASVLGFRSDDIKQYPDLEMFEIEAMLENVSKKDHSDADCIMVFVLHNDIVETGILDPFRDDRCTTLISKPKIFFLRYRIDPGDDTQTLEDQRSSLIDVLVYGESFFKNFWEENADDEFADVHFIPKLTKIVTEAVRMKTSNDLGALIWDLQSSCEESVYFTSLSKKVLFLPKLLFVFERFFQPTRIIGRGGFGTVIEAKHKLDGNNYAIKMIRLRLEEEEIKQTLMEAQVLASLNHSGIVRYFTAWIDRSPVGLMLSDGSVIIGYSGYSDSSKSQSSQQGTEGGSKVSDDYVVFNSQASITGGFHGLQLDSSGTTETEASHGAEIHYKDSRKCLYIQMELCEWTLRNWLETNKEREHKEVMKIFSQIMDAVKYLHSKTLYHSDLKAENILLTSDGIVKIGDFGLTSLRSSGSDAIAGTSKQCNQNSKSSTSNTSKSIREDPEKLDIHRLGIIFFELMEWIDPEERITKIRNIEQLQFPPDFERRYPNEGKLLKKMLSLNANERPTAEEIWHYLPHIDLRKRH